MEGHDTSPEVARVEWYVDTRQGDSGNMLQLEDFCRLRAFSRLDNITEHLLDLLDGLGLRAMQRIRD